MTAMAAVVVFCTTYALILPAITQENKPTCGKEAHEHEASCYRQPEKYLMCAAQTHIHGLECLDDRGFAVCGYDSYLIHSHEDHCYDAQGTPICPLPEQAVHQHREGCYAVPEPDASTHPAHEHGEECYETVPPVLICGQETDTGHHHSEEGGCYTYETVLCCGLEETQGHRHGEDCFDAEGNLLCTQAEVPGHTHGGDCLETKALLICDLEETQGHAHVDSCYEVQEPILICGLEEAAPSETGPVLICGFGQPVFHQHEEGCFRSETEEPELICEIEEHIHDDLRCYTDYSADLESEEDWIKTLPELSGRWEEDIVAVADSQIGYMESTRNYWVEEDGTVKGYTRYGQWYGSPYGDWCAMFVSFCLHYAEVPAETVPKEASCRKWVELLKTGELYLPEEESRSQEGEFLPGAGDLVFFDYDGDGISTHVGIVEYVEDEILHTIEGNAYNSVRRQEYELTDPVILGYGLVPEQPEEAAGEEETTVPETVLTEQTIRAVIYTNETLAQPAEDETVILISGLLPEGAAAVAYAVELEMDLIEGETVLLAYDITILDGSGGPFVQEEGQSPFRVSIQPPGWTAQEDETYSVYYVPEDGEPEMMDCESEEDAVSFTTDHFSTYALTATGTSATVYLNGDTGDDGNAGTGTSVPVKTLDRALKLVREGGTIYISGTVAVSGETEWDLEDSTVTLKRYSSFTGPLVLVENGGSLTLRNITINGGSGTPSASSIATNTTYASGSAKAPIILVQSGGSLNICNGAVLEYNSNKPDVSSNDFVENGYVGQGGAVYCQGDLNMSGGTIRYCEAESGGGIYIESANTNRITFHLSGGLITYNYAREISPTSYRKTPYHRNAGGGIYVGDYVTMYMSGGTISYNQTSREGGGISLGWLNRSNGAAIYDFITTFHMTGGTLDHNTATSTGGGLNITAGREAYISAGYFTNNTANGNEYQHSNSGTIMPVYSGGGIYLDDAQYNKNGTAKDGKPGYALIHRVLITNNTSDSYCGGIATCSTSSTYISSNLQMDGTLIFGNRTGSQTAANSSQLSLNGKVKLVSDTALGGIAYKWDKSYRNTLSESDENVKAAMQLATVIITGNDAYDGGGIGCNGSIEIGGEENPGDITISITKIWDDAGDIPHPDHITVQLYQDGIAWGTPIVIRKQLDVSGEEYWPVVYVDQLPSGHEYTIRELEADQYSVEITQNGNQFTITNSIKGFTVEKKWAGDSETDRPGAITVQLYRDGEAYGDPVTLTAANGWKYIWIGLPEGYAYTAEEVSIPEGYYSEDNGQLIEPDVWQITNTKIPTISVSVEKRWEGGMADSVTVSLLSNGVVMDSVVLNGENNWLYQWKDLPRCNAQGTDIAYTVREDPVKGYSSLITTGTPPANTTVRWVAETPKSGDGESYLIVSEQGALAVSGSSLAWMDVSEILQSGAVAPNTALWTWNNSLKNGDGQYLYLSGRSSYSFSPGTTQTTVSLSQGKISASGGSRTRYLTGIDSGKGTTSTSSYSAMSFTFYRRVEETTSIDSDLHFIVTNAKLPDFITFHFGKYAVGASEQPTLLAGAELELYKVADSGDVTIPGTDVKGTLADSWTSENASGANGGIHVKELFSGTYYLIETRTPPGHLGLSGPVIFEVNAEAGAVNLIACPYELTLSGETEVEFPIYNTVTYALPETGGPGTVLYTAGGLLMTITSAVLLLIMSSKRRRGSHNYL